MANYQNWPPKPIGKIPTVAIWVFLSIWILFMTTALTGGGCAKASIEAEKRIVYCNISLGIWSTFFSWADPHKMSGNHITRALVYVELENAAQAKQDMKKSIELAAFGKPREALWKLIYPEATSPTTTRQSKPAPWIPRLIARINHPEISKEAKKIWDEVLIETLSVSEKIARRHQPNRFMPPLPTYQASRIPPLPRYG